METAIKRAIEGGYKIEPTGEFLGKPVLDKNKILLDPQFWQCLGKAEGWREDKVLAAHKNVDGWKNDAIKPGEWRYRWHSFIDHLASGKDIESFFKDLLIPSHI